MAIPFLYLRSLGAIFLVAFWSFYVQFPGLLSSSGLEPVHRLVPYASPWLHRIFIQSQLMDDDTLVELLTVMGMCLSALVLAGRIQHGAVVLSLTVVYAFLGRVGGTFYSFQWDTLLVETGAVTALCYAPWTSLGYYNNDDNNNKQLATNTPSKNAPGVGAWPLRFLLFKLMFMSGLVKIQSECPTWQQLTALEYHFATQCLPGPLAWYAHQMHPFLLRLSVALTLWIEMPLTLLLLGWTTNIRRVGAYWQIFLQIMIILTGNYNFFNLLTVALCLPCLALDGDGSEKPLEASSGTLVYRQWEHRGITIFSVGTFLAMFRIYQSHPSLDLWHGLNISVSVSKSFCEQATELLLPWIIPAVMLYVVVNGSRQAWTRKKPLLVLHMIVCVLVIGVIAIPMCSLTEIAQSNGFVGSRHVFQPLWQKYALPYRAANGYGLFRRMTGVGRAFMETNAGWAGLGPSVVARPEIILQGLFETSNDAELNGTSVAKWREIQFRWKPGHTNVLPPQVAPHQPRLDWQMWFAALGGSQQNPWFIHLIQKLLDGCEDVNQLVGDQRLLSGQRMKKLRANLYHYDFTRLNTEWNRRIPNAKIASFNRTLSDCLFRPSKIWTRKFARKYLLPMEKDNHPIKEFLSAHGYKSTCRRNRDRCKQKPSVWCHLSTAIRWYHLHLVALVLILVVARPKPSRQNQSVSLSKKNK